MLKNWFCPNFLSLPKKSEFPQIWGGCSPPCPPGPYAYGFSFCLFSSSLHNNNSSRKKGCTDASSKNCGYRSIGKVLAQSQNLGSSVFFMGLKIWFLGWLGDFVSPSRILKPGSRSLVPYSKEKGKNRGGLLPYKRLMGMCRWTWSHFHHWIDYFNGVTRMGPHIFGFLE